MSAEKNIVADYGCTVDLKISHLYKDEDGAQQAILFTGCTSSFVVVGPDGVTVLFDLDESDGITVEEAGEPPTGIVLRTLITPDMWPAAASFNKDLTYSYSWLVELAAGVLGGPKYKALFGSFVVKHSEGA